MDDRVCRDVRGCLSVYRRPRAHVDQVGHSDEKGTEPLLKNIHKVTITFA